MNLKGLFQRLRPPKKGGSEASPVTELQTVTRYFLAFSNIENSPEYALETELSVGSGTGDIVIADDSLSPRHATFKLDHGAVTVMDLGSTAGTRIGDHSLTKGKPVLLKPDDVLHLGEIEITLKAVEEIVAEPPAASVVAEADAEEDSLPEMPADGPENEPEAPPAPEKTSFFQRRLRTLKNTPAEKKKPKIVAANSGRTYAANLLPRLVAIGIDFCWTFVIWTVMSPFDDFRDLLEVVPGLLHDYVLPQLELVISQNGWGEFYQTGLTSFLDLVKEPERELWLSHVVSLYFTVRVATTFVLGVSLGQWMSGIRSFGGFVASRLGGVVRELLAIFTWAFVILDLPTLFSRRSFKEMITGTHLVSVSKGATLISWLVFLPVTLAAVSVSPLFSGLEEPEAVLLKDITPKKRVRNEGSIEMTTYSSNWFGAQFVLPNETWSVVPRFTWSQNGKVRSLTPTLAFYHYNGTTVPLILHSKFRWDELLKTALSHNPLLQKNFPTLWSVVQGQMIGQQAAIRFNLSENQKAIFKEELQELIRVSFALSLDSVADHVLTHGPLLKGLVAFRKMLMAQVGVAPDAEWALTRFGRSSVLIYEVPGVKPYDILLPLEYGEGRMFRVNYASTKERGQANKLAFSELWALSVWTLPETANYAGLPFVIDAIARLATVPAEPAETFEKMYEAFFEAAAFVVQRPEDDFRRRPLILSLKNVSS
ncbi:MAG: FHA domain-containing protein, partial [Bacteriovoracia bacterium]